MNKPNIGQNIEVDASWILGFDCGSDSWIKAKVVGFNDDPSRGALMRPEDIKNLGELISDLIKAAGEVSEYPASISSGRRLDLACAAWMLARKGRRAGEANRAAVSVDTTMLIRFTHSTKSRGEIENVPKS